MNEFLYIIAIVLLIFLLAVFSSNSGPTFIGKSVVVQNKEYIIIKEPVNDEYTLALADGSSNATITLNVEVIKHLINSKVEK
jgi:hypothetical protein